MKDLFEHNRLCKLLHIDFPLIQSGMGGITSPNLVSSVSNEGCAGVLGLYKFRGDQIKQFIRETKIKSNNKFFGLNLIPEVISSDFLNSQLNAIFSTTTDNIFIIFYGLPDEKTWGKCRKYHLPYFAQIGHQDIEKGIKMGFDGLVIQGIEAGGHLLGSLDLFNSLEVIPKQLGDTILLVSGGIGSGKQFADIFRVFKNVEGVLCGTLFLTTQESLAHPDYKQKVINSTSKDTVICDTFSYGWPGRSHRVLANRVTRNPNLPSIVIGNINLEGVQHPIHRFSANIPNVFTEGNVSEMAMYCGTSCSQVSQIKTVKQVIHDFKNDFFKQIAEN